MAAIRSFGEPLVLMVGGRDKKLPWDEFAALVYQRVDHLIVFGEAAEIILRAMERTLPVAEIGDLAGNTVAQPTIDRCSGLREAVQAAARRVEPGDVVLLSPGGTSFDEFRDFEERGECFVQWVNELA
jgi:UDP-N-acetylmuramoylalanine--D-glutamate ligase